MPESEKADANGSSMTWWEAAGVEPIPCCEHCHCGTANGLWPTRDGHDDSCRICRDGDDD